MVVQEANAGTNPGSGPANYGVDVPGGGTRGGRRSLPSAIGASMDYFLEDWLLSIDALLLRRWFFECWREFEDCQMPPHSRVPLARGRRTSTSTSTSTSICIGISIAISFNTSAIISIRINPGISISTSICISIGISISISISININTRTRTRW